MGSVIGSVGGSLLGNAVGGPIGGMIGSQIGGSLFGGDSGNAGGSASYNQYAGSTKSVNEYPAEYQPIIKNYINKASAQFAKPYQVYTGQRFADFNTDQNNAFNAYRADVGRYDSQMDNINNTANTLAGNIVKNSTYDPNSFQQFMNPYAQSVTDIAKRKAIEEGQRQLNAIGSQSRNAFGGSRQAILESTADRNLAQNLSDLDVKGLSDAYTNAQNMSLNAYKANLAGQSQGFSDLNNMQGILTNQQNLRNSATQNVLNVGNTLQTNTQARLDDARKDFTDQQAYDIQNISFGLNNLVNPIATNFTTQTTTKYDPYSKSANQMANALNSSNLASSLSNSMNGGSLGSIYNSIFGSAPDANGISWNPSSFGSGISNMFSNIGSGLSSIGSWLGFKDGGPVKTSFATGGSVSTDAFNDLIYRQMMAESGGDPNATSEKGAFGLMQLMPATAANPGFGVTPARDNSPAENLRVGQDYTRALLEHYGDPKLALMAYNWGPSNVDSWMQNGGDWSRVPAETQNYVNKVLNNGELTTSTVDLPVISSDFTSGDLVPVSPERLSAARQYQKANLDYANNVLRTNYLQKQNDFINEYPALAGLREGLVAPVPNSIFIQPDQAAAITAARIAGQPVIKNAVLPNASGVFGGGSSGGISGEVNIPVKGPSAIQTTLGDIDNILRSVTGARNSNIQDRLAATPNYTGINFDPRMAAAAAAMSDLAGVDARAMAKGVKAYSDTDEGIKDKRYGLLDKGIEGSLSDAETAAKLVKEDDDIRVKQQEIANQATNAYARIYDRPTEQEKNLAKAAHDYMKTQAAAGKNITYPEAYAFVSSQQSQDPRIPMPLN